MQALWTFVRHFPSHFVTRARSSEEPPPRKRLIDVSSTRFSIGIHPLESVAGIFLNCTKNTELTPRLFPRTFSFALSIKKKLNSAQTTTGRDERAPSSTSVSNNFTIETTSGQHMKATPWITYRTRFLVKAKQLTTSLTFTDVLGRQHSGRKGDYLVESSDGVLRIAPRQIFEDIYVPLLADQASESATQSQEALVLPTTQRKKQMWRHQPSGRREIPDTLSLPPQLVRKSPQSERSRRNFVSGLNSV